ncbi:hypothetical protein BDN71DRAFT_1438744 [Pleurotus eryngii]|uniref:Uncharacterized protein n=1 Tax=Pleurotus eryngii TaxID=5323 RepID=A0A9P6DL78_PLEER|nr:hypothetical protein BDN71DRAFT_1438744 [Pleurotus eryngii]
MPPTNANSTAYTKNAHTTAPTSRRIPSELNGNTPAVNGPRVTGPTTAHAGSHLARYRPLQFSKFPLFTGQKARRSGFGSSRRRGTSGQNFAAASSPQPLTPTITAEHDPGPPLVYSPSIPLHASIVPNVSIPGGKPGSSNYDPSAPKAGTGASVTDIVVITVSIVLGVALVAIVAFIYKIRRGNRVQVPQLGEKHAGDIALTEPQARQTFDGKTITSASWSTPTLTKSPGATQSTDTFKEYNKELGSQETIGEPRVVEPHISTPHDSPFVISGSQSLATVSCDASDHGSMNGFSLYAPLDEGFQEKLRNEESDIVCVLSYAVSDNLIVLEAAPRTGEEAGFVEDIPPSNANEDDFDPGVTIRSDEFESTYCNDTIATEFSIVETAESRNLEATKAVLILVSSEAEASQGAQPTRPDTSSGSTPEAANLLNSIECQSAIASIITTASCNSLLQPPSLMITQPSSNNVFGLHSSSSTVTVDLNEFPPPPPPRVEVPLPQLELDFPVYMWDEDGDMLTVHQRNTVTDQFISMYS